MIRTLIEFALVMAATACVLSGRLALFAVAAALLAAGAAWRRITR